MNAQDRLDNIGIIKWLFAALPLILLCTPSSSTPSGPLREERPSEDLMQLYGRECEASASASSDDSVFRLGSHLIYRSTQSCVDNLFCETRIISESLHICSDPIYTTGPIHQVHVSIFDAVEEGVDEDVIDSRISPPFHLRGQDGIYLLVETDNALYVYFVEN